MGLIQEFKNFAIKGNAIDMAVGIIIGGAFGKIVSSLVSDVIMPPLGILIGGMDFTNFSYVLKAAEGTEPQVTLKYGSFIQVTLDFLILSFVIFAMIKLINRLKKKEEAAPSVVVPPTKEEALLAEIRDILRQQKS